MKGKVQTVLGEVNPSDLGRVLTHEHFEKQFQQEFLKQPLFKPELKDCEFSLKNLGWIRQFPYSHLHNINVRGIEVREAFLEEMKQYKLFGGGTVVDNTTYGIKYSDRSELTKRISRETGIHIITSTGFYITRYQSESSLALPEEKMVALMTKDLTEGCEEDPTVKCGVVGEVGCSWPLTEFEYRSLRASAEVEKTVGCPVMVHPGRNIRGPEEIVRIFTEAGGNPRRLVMAHLDRTFLNNEDALEFASMGTFLEYDLFGIETSYYQHDEEVNMPSDGQRIRKIQALLQEGYEDRVLVSHDIHTRHRLERYGGHGFSHILKVVLPMMLKRGIPQETIDKIQIHNPANWLTFIK